MKLYMYNSNNYLIHVPDYFKLLNAVLKNQDQSCTTVIISHVLTFCPDHGKAEQLLTLLACSCLLVQSESTQ